MESTAGTKIPVNLDLRSRFEFPCVIQAKLRPMNWIEVGAFSGVYGGSLGHCSIGRYCSIAPDVDVASDQHPLEWLSTSMIQYVDNVHGWKNGLGCFDFEPKAFSSNSRVFIGNDVWIGRGAFVLSGVKIGDGAVVAAHSVVLKDVPPYAVVAGVPAKLVRFRFSNELISELMDLKWWRFNLLDFVGLDFSDIKGCVDQIVSLEKEGLVKEYQPDWFDQNGVSVR